MEYSKLKVGDKVAVGRYSRYNHGNWQGVYTVTKTNKMRVDLVRDGDQYSRSFSVKTRSELGRVGSDNTYITEVSVMETDLTRASAEAVRRNLWGDVANATKNQNLEELKALVAKLESFN